MTVDALKPSTISPRNKSAPGENGGTRTPSKFLARLDPKAERFLFGTYATKDEALAIRNRLIAVGGFARVAEGQTDEPKQTTCRARAGRR